MSTRATGTVEMKSWDEKTWDGKPHNEVSGHKLTQGTMVGGYHGDLEASGETRFVMTYADDNNCESIGHELVNGALGDRTGTFVLQHVSGYHDGTVTGGFTVVAGSGTGGLAGLSGRGEIVWVEGQNGTYSLEYDLPS
ncbi:DUF3224 domain-containing protein [Umezawaea sp. Da 62-37]|uniref:DUF3224 domain-containing protein n=1 Tax=Umezawaea sp. Da 62-37 TaxID=3075927 RepID=UPI0028F6F85E|nr:DUF3224 domain-containing protein [Umezawaea sp. Da 62-37]WNV89326.1 DUF3224 domain-containing protein [Umezawaea sp. Da 62-37]